jgi:hypothetical protein
MPKHRRQQAAFLTEAQIRLFARKIRNALLVNAVVLAALRAKENVWCPATMLTASIPEVVAAATVVWSIFSVRLARGRNTHPLRRVSLAVAQRPAPRKQIAEKRVWSVARASALSRDARTWQARNLQGGAALVTRTESVLVKKAFAAAFILRALSPLVLLGLTPSQTYTF